MNAAPIRAFSWRALPWVLFTISLALNVFFIGGHFYARQFGGDAGRQADTAKPPAARTRITIDQVGLDVAQRGQFLTLRARIEERRKTYREGSRGHAARLWAELEKDKPSTRAIERSLRRIADNRYTYERRAAAHALAFMAGLDANQKGRFLALAKSRGFLGAHLLRDRPKESN